MKSLPSPTADPASAVTHELAPGAVVYFTPDPNSSGCVFSGPPLIDLDIASAHLIGRPSPTTAKRASCSHSEPIINAGVDRDGRPQLMIAAEPAIFRLFPSECISDEDLPIRTAHTVTVIVMGLHGSGTGTSRKPPTPSHRPGIVRPSRGRLVKRARCAPLLGIPVGSRVDAEIDCNLSIHFPLKSCVTTLVGPFLNLTRQP